MLKFTMTMFWQLKLLTNLYCSKLMFEKNKHKMTKIGTKFDKSRDPTIIMNKNIPFVY